MAEIALPKPIQASTLPSLQKSTSTTVESAVVEERKSILPAEFRGVAYLCGPRGVGKSFLASQADIPDNVLFFDWEEKGSGIDVQLHFGRYLSMSSLASRKFGLDHKPAQVMEILREQLNQIPKDRFTVAVIDNIEPMEAAFAAEAKKYPMQYGISPKNAESGAFGGIYPAVNYMVSGFVNNLYAKGVKLVIVTAHLKAVWSSTGPIPNRFKPKGVERWQELSILSLVLMTAENAPIPSAIVQQEQLASTKYNEETQEIEVTRRLPLRIPKCTFAEIRRYMREPADLKNPKAGEVPTSEETLPYSDRFSHEQLAYMTAAANAQAAGRPEESNEDK
jgi:hypothetical protein